MVDLSAFQIFELEGPGAVEFADYLAVNKIDGPSAARLHAVAHARGRIPFRPHHDAHGRRHVRIVTGVFDGGRDEFWVRKHMPNDGSVTFTNLTKQISTLGLWGPNAAPVLGQLTDHDLSQEGSPYGSYLPVNIAGVDCHLFRISYVGDAGWEIYVPWDDATTVWDAIMEAGADHGLRITGGGVYSLSGRIEKGYRLMGAELESEYNPVEAGLARPKVKAADFIGKEAYLAARDAGAEVQCVTLIVDDNTDRNGNAPLHAGRQRADPHSRRGTHRRFTRPCLAGHHRGLRPVARQEPPHGVPAQRVSCARHQAAGRCT